MAFAQLREGVLQELVGPRIRLRVEVLLHHAHHVLEEPVAVTVGGIGAVGALHPADARPLGIDVIELVDDRVELGDPVRPAA